MMRTCMQCGQMYSARNEDTGAYLVSFCSRECESDYERELEIHIKAEGAKADKNTHVLWVGPEGTGGVMITPKGKMGVWAGDVFVTLSFETWVKLGSKIEVAIKVKEFLCQFLTQIWYKNIL